MDVWDGLGAALFAVVGVVIGALVTHGLARVTADIEWKRSEAKRLIELRLLSYVNFARVVKDDVRASRRMAASLGAADTDHPLGRDEGERQLEAINSRRSTALEDVLLVGSSELVEHARVWQYAASRLRKRVLAQPDISPHEFEILYRKTGYARDRFYQGARRDLDVVGDVGALSNDELEPYWAALPDS